MSLKLTTSRFNGKFQKRYVGENTEPAEIVKEPTDFPGKLYPYWERMDEADYMPIDAQGYDTLISKHHEPHTPHQDPDREATDTA